MKQDKTDEGYISNKYLRELIIKFNQMNINDTGEWCDAYDEERRKFNAEFEIVKKDICDAFLKVINGRIISFKLIQTPAYEDVNDIKQECMMTLFMYINRYDETRNSSAFAFVTQLITNAINLYLNEMNEHNEKEISGLDFYENLNTIDDPYGGNDN